MGDGLDHAIVTNALGFAVHRIGFNVLQAEVASITTRTSVAIVTALSAVAATATVASAVATATASGIS